MATTSKVDLTTSHAGVYHVPSIEQVSATKGSEVLQENHNQHHCFFNADGFHNHIAHHILTLYALGATPDDIQKGYDLNKDYQRPPGEEKAKVLQDLRDRRKFQQYLGKSQYYAEFLQFFQSQMEEKGVGQTFQDYIFAGDVLANRMLGQLFAGFLHPIIHAGFGIEFSQPAIIAEGLAMCAVSSSGLNKYFDGIKGHISTTGQPPSTKSLFDLLQETQSNSTLTSCIQWEDSNKLRDGVLARGSKEMIEIAAQWRVMPDDSLAQKTAEMTDFCAYFTGAAQNPQKQVKFDFFFMHCINSSIFFWSFLDQPWLTTEQKSILLEYKGWADLAMYVSRGSPKLYLEEITEYEEKQPGGWTTIFERVNRLEDDGHASKFIRALANGQDKCKLWEEKENWPIKGTTWLKFAHMVIDSVEAEGDNWVRSCGFPQAWESFADRKKKVQPSYEAL